MAQQSRQGQIDRVFVEPARTIKLNSRPEPFAEQFELFRLLRELGSRGLEEPQLRIGQGLLHASLCAPASDTAMAGPVRLAANCWWMETIKG